MIERSGIVAYLNMRTQAGYDFDQDDYLDNIDRRVFKVDISTDGTDIRMKPVVPGDKQLLRDVTVLFEHATQLQSLDPVTIIKQSRLRKQANALLHGNDYRIGANFVVKGLALLTAAGMQEGDALITLIENPPSTIDELLDPRKYVAEKLLVERE